MSKSFFDKDDYTFSDLENLINDQIEESINLDYKSARSLDKADGKKRELAKDISAFSNSDGGIIIYGIEEENHKPTIFSFVDGSILTKEWLENIIDGNIQPRIQGIKITPIRIENDLKKTVYIVKIPESENAPHMSTDKKYYRRYNFKSVPMEEYEVRNLYNRSSSAEIDFESVWSKHLDEITEDGILKIRKEIFIYVRNISQSLEKHCKIEASFKNINGLGVGFSYYRDSNVGQRFSKEKNVVITAYNESPIFPDEEYPILRFELKVDKNHIDEFKKQAKLEITLFDSSTTKSYDHDLDNLMEMQTYNNL
ncbi:ATP-binding protein [Olleya sp. UBA1516]|uniref:AlbA family DNA-binding domain-containing protein n=1 Tax=Olleya sp. UBA1516 TaxID=1947013 RepID=UPI0025EE2D60|nr:ATP-binding protein [Olleya sp. UBA1516]|tara:strand:- start:75604 stop:76536 length:933 start_codon:yes stop_codon:yes gene_type:complete